MSDLNKYAKMGIVTRDKALSKLVDERLRHHRPIVALGRKASNGTVEVTDVLTFNFPDMTNAEAAELSRKLDQWSNQYQNTKGGE